MSSFRLSYGEERSVGVRPFQELAQSASVEEVLEGFTKIAVERGIELCSVSFTRARLEQELKVSTAGEQGGRICVLDIHVEGGQTRLIVKFYEPAKPWVRTHLELAAQLAAHRIELLAGNRLRPDREGKGSSGAPLIAGLIGDSEPMQEVRRKILAFAENDHTVLITGESGTGKEIVAQRIHDLSRRAKHPFIAVNCGALSETLIESELFGHERGAFTGADRQRKGRFELADKGTLFLDEVGELSPSIQVKLLRVLQERQFERLGGTHPIKVDIRLIAATNRDLLHEVAEHRFRHDLYYRLNVLSLQTPALREHTEDIPLLAYHFLDLTPQRPGIEEGAMDLFRRYRWPGNVRELEAMIERLAVEAGNGGEITEAQAGRETALEQTAAPGDIEFPAILHKGEILDLFLPRQELIVYQIVLNACGGNHSLAAQRLGIGRTALYNRIKRVRRLLAGH